MIIHIPLHKIISAYSLDQTWVSYFHSLYVPCVARSRNVTSRNGYINLRSSAPISSYVILKNCFFPS